MRDYLENNPTVSESNRRLCDGVGSDKKSEVRSYIGLKSRHGNDEIASFHSVPVAMTRLLKSGHYNERK